MSNYATMSDKEFVHMLSTCKTFDDVIQVQQGLSDAKREIVPIMWQRALDHLSTFNPNGYRTYGRLRRFGRLAAIRMLELSRCQQH